MLLMSWPLWVDVSEIPRVPFVRGISQIEGAAAWGVFALLVASVGYFATAAHWRLAYAVSLVLLTFLVLGDQHRFQPWAYQYLVSGLLLAGLPCGTGVAFARFWFVSLYVHSGLSKLDVSFHHEMGGLFLATLAGLLGLDPASWPSAVRTAAILAMPAGEILVAGALLVPSTRRVGLAGATVMHLTLVAVLGPLGLGHSPIVLVWNIAMLLEVWAAFGGRAEPVRKWSMGAPGRRPLGVAVVFAFVAGILLPFGERRGVFDAWPSHALYASHVERLHVDLHESSLGDFPAGVRRNAFPLPDGAWHRLDLTGWSRQIRGTPVYPANRAGLGLAEHLAARYGERTLVRVILFGNADRFTGGRPRTELIGLDAIRTQGGRYRINARPATRRVVGARRPAGRVSPSTPGQDEESE